jgi:hypothetical protein
MFEDAYTTEEWRTLQFAPLWAYSIVAGIEGDVDDAERIALAAELARAASNEDPLVREILGSVARDEASVVPAYNADPRDPVSGLGDVANVLGRAAPAQAEAFKHAVLELARTVAGASGSGPGGIGLRERAALELVASSLGTGRLATGAGEPAPVERRKRAWQAVFGLLGFAGGVAAAIYAYTVADSIWLSIFVFGAVAYVVGRALCDVITDDHKLLRILYFSVLPVASIAILYVTYEAWEKWWLAVVLGIVGGQLLSAVIWKTFFPRIHGEEEQDSWRRMAQQFGQSAQP